MTVRTEDAKDLLHCVIDLPACDRRMAFWQRWWPPCLNSSFIRHPINTEETQISVWISIVQRLSAVFGTNRVGKARLQMTKNLVNGIRGYIHILHDISRLSSTTISPSRLVTLLYMRYHLNPRRRPVHANRHRPQANKCLDHNVQPAQHENEHHELPQLFRKPI